MRARERARVERHAARALALVAPDLRLLVGWSREAIPWASAPHGVHAEAFTFGRDAVVVIDERRFEEATADDREDTVRHELAHLLAWLHGPTREADALASQLDGARQILTHAIGYLRESFARVDVVCAVGNHGRWPHSHGRAVSSKWDGAVMVLYRALEAVFARDTGVTWTIPRTPYATWNAPGGAVCALTHGDTVVHAGQPGRTVHTHRIADQLRRWNSARAAQGEPPIRALALGHYHVPMRVCLDDGLDVVVNGCLGGTAAYAQGAYGVHGSRPSQVIWESTARHPVGDLRVVEVGCADDDPSLDAICPPVVAIGEAA